MSFLGLRLLALSSIAAIAAQGATRPRYGGSLQLETSPLPDLATSHLVVERLVRLDRAGYVRGWLAQKWQHDAEFKRWRLTLRPNVLFHDGAPLTAAVVAPILAAALRLDCAASGQTVIVRSEKPLPALLARLAASETAIVRRDSAGNLIGTGPFRVATVEPGRRITLAAFEDYWGGRPYLDRVEFSLLPPRPSYQPAVADVWRLPVNVSGRAVPEAMRIWTSEPRDLIVLTMGGAAPAVREAVALSIDRESIVNVLTQRRGEAAYSLLPEWLSGYAFLFGSSPDAAPARQVGSALRAQPLDIGAPPDDPLARLVAERIIVNARDAGLMLRLATRRDTPLEVVRLRLSLNDPRNALAMLLFELGIPPLASPATLESAYEMEGAALQDRRILPVVFVPDVYAIAPRVRNWNEAQRPRDGLLHLENLWVER